MRCRTAARGSLLLAMLAVFAPFVAAGCGDGGQGRSEPKTVSYVIPSGISARIATGEQLDIMPDHVVLGVGDTLYIRNDDSLGQHIGPYYVEGRNELRLTYNDPGVFTGTCALSKSGNFTVEVRA